MSRSFIPVPVGTRFGRLVVLRELEMIPLSNGGHRRYVECQCDCGTVARIPLYGLLRKSPTLSCGCLKCETAHNQKRLIYGVGVNDSDTIVFSNSDASIKDLAYKKWYGMINRCYNPKELQKRPTYKNCSVCDEWLYFSNFKRWFSDNYVEGYQLDKDILIKGNKVYSPDACCFVPQEINGLFTRREADRGSYPIGVTLKDKKYYARISKNGKQRLLTGFNTIEEAFNKYKSVKEAYIQEVGTRYYSKGAITERVYDALMRYRVNIDD